MPGMQPPMAFVLRFCPLLAVALAHGGFQSAVRLEVAEVQQQASEFRGSSG